MKALKALLVSILVCQLSLGPLLAQPVILQPNPFESRTGTGVTNLRIVRQSADGTEVILTMEYSYDGFAGNNALAIPVIEKRNQKGVSAWFGSDPVAIGRGKGLISMTIKYFNDEPGVPPEFTSDRLRILILNQSGTAILSSIPFLKNIKWGSANAPKPPALAEIPAPVSTAPASTGPIANNAELVARQQAAANEARLRAQAQQQAEAEAKARQIAEEKARAEAAARELARSKAEAESKRLADETARQQLELKQREEARLKAEREATRLADERRQAEAKARAEAQAREEARVKAEVEATRLAREKALAEEKARAESIAREAARLKAEAAAVRLAQEKAIAEEKVRAEARVREAARLKAEADAKRLAEEKRIADQKAKAEAEVKEKARLLAEAKAREQERLKAEAEAKRLAQEKTIAETKARAEAQAREEARLRADAESRRLAREKAEAELKSRAEANAREEARLKAEVEAKRLAEERRLADEKARAEAKAREEARLHAEAEEKRLAEEKRVAEQKARAEAEAREQARLKAAAEEKRLAQEKAVAEEKARIEAAARLVAEQKAKAEAEARARAEEESRKLAATAAAPAIPPASPASPPSAPVADPGAASFSLEPTPGLKSKITNVDVVNRSMDRTQMTIGVEYEYRDNIGPKPLLGVNIAKLNDPAGSRQFKSLPAEIGKSRRNFLLFPVKFQPASGLASFSTDKVLVYLQEAASPKRLNLHVATMLLLWRAPGASASESAKTGSTVEIDDFKQNAAHSGYVTVKYNLPTGPGKLRIKIYDSANPSSAEWFDTPIKPVRAGRGIEILDIMVKSNAKSPTPLLRANQIEIELIDASGGVAAKVSRQVPMAWEKPE
jgi:hypothetical protein